MGWNRTEGRGYKDFKKGGGQAGSRGGYLKKRGSWNPLTNYDVVLIYLLNRMMSLFNTVSTTITLGSSSTRARKNCFYRYIIEK